MISRRLLLSGVARGRALRLRRARAAQTYPAKPVRIIVPFAPGGVDVTARLIADRLTRGARPAVHCREPSRRRRLGRRQGGRELRARRPHAAVQHARPGGGQPGDQQNAGYDAVKSFAPVAIVSQSPLMLVIHPSVPAKTVQRARGLCQGQSRQGALPLPGLRHPAASGRRDVQVDDRHRHRARSLSRFGARDHRPARRTDADVFRQLRQRAAARRERQAARARGHRRRARPQLPDVPTMDESGYGGIEATYWNGMLAPAGTPPAIVARLNAAVNKALASPEVRAALHEARFRSQEWNTAGIRRLHRGGGAALGQGRPRRQHQGRMTTAGRYDRTGGYRKELCHQLNLMIERLSQRPRQHSKKAVWDFGTRERSCGWPRLFWRRPGGAVGFVCFGGSAGSPAIRAARSGPISRASSAIRESGQRVIIDGPCLSACTLVLGVIPRERICVTRRARLGFHAAWHHGENGRPVTSRGGTQLLMAVYPANVKSWLNKRGGLTRQDENISPAASSPRCIRPASNGRRKRLDDEAGGTVSLRRNFCYQHRPARTSFGRIRCRV